MLPLFSAATEEQFRDFAGKLKAKLKDKFNVVLGQSKILHAIAEINGFRNWQSLKATIDDREGREHWIVSVGLADTWTISVLATDRSSALTAFLADVESAIRLIPKEFGWEIVGQDVDALFSGLFFLVNDKPMVSMTRVGLLSSVDGPDLDAFSMDNAALAGLCHEALESVGTEDDANQRKKNALRTMVAIATTSTIEDEVLDTGARDVSAGDRDALEVVKALKDSKQFVTLSTYIQGGRHYG
jgi:hypothetical protein